MAEWTLCADLKVYADTSSAAKPAGRPAPCAVNFRPDCDQRHGEGRTRRAPTALLM